MKTKVLEVSRAARGKAAAVGRFGAAAALAAAVAWPGAASALDVVYTLDAHFDLGTLSGVNHDAPNNDQLQLGSAGNAFSVMWIANAGEDTVSKIDTNQVNGPPNPGPFVPGCELARYGTWINHGGNHGAFSGPAPSRTAVDGDGNVYVANRHFDGRPPSVMKILADDFIDRNGNGVVDTSADANNDCIIQPGEVIQLLDNNPANGILDNAELRDERVAWIVQLPASENGQLGRALCIAPDGNIWAGSHFNRRFYELRASDGAILQGPVNIGVTTYGCLIDAAGVLWSADLGNTLGVLDTNVPAGIGTHGHGQFGSNYGIAIGTDPGLSGATAVYLGGNCASYIRFNPNTNTFDTPAEFFYCTLGISVDANGDIVLGDNRVSKFRPGPLGAPGPHLQIWSVINPDVGNVGQRGVIPDQDGDVWTVNLGANSVSKFRASDGLYLGTMPVGNAPYTYSDANGSAFRTVTNPQGTWEVIADGGGAGATWSQVIWNTEPEGNVPTGASINVEVRAGDANPPAGPFVPVANGGNPGVAGRFLQIRAVLRPNPGGQSPVLSDLRATAAVACDVDGSGSIDIDDINAIMAARNTPAGPGDPRDPDGNGVINANDARQCVLRCSLPRCARPA